MKTLTWIWNALKSIYKFFAQWNELITVPFIIALYIFVIPVIRMIDPEAGAYDGGYLLKPVMVVIHFLIYHAVAWVIFKITFPKVFNYLDQLFEGKVFTEGIGELTEWKKVWVSLLVFLFYLLGLILVSLSV